VQPSPSPRGRTAEGVGQQQVGRRPRGGGLGSVEVPSGNQGQQAADQAMVSAAVVWLAGATMGGHSEAEVRPPDATGMGGAMAWRSRALTVMLVCSV
jgi:hypothetical protein